MTEINIGTREDWNEGEFDKTSADRDDESGNLGLGYVNGDFSGVTTQPDEMLCQLRLDTSSADDYSGQSRSTSVGGSPSTNNGIFGTGALDFGSGDSIEITDTNDIDVPSAGFTAAIWFKTSDPQAHADEPEHFLFAHNDGGSGAAGNYAWGLAHDAAGGRDTFHWIVVGESVDDTDPTPWHVTAGTSFYDNEWHLAVGVYDPNDSGNEVKLYMDANLEDDRELDESLNNPNGEVVIGGHPASGREDRSFNADISDAMFFDKALTQSEIETLYFDGHENNNFEGSYESKHLDELEGEADEITINASVSSGETLTVTVVALDSGGSEIDTSDPISVQDGENTYDVENLQEGNQYRVDFDMEVDQ